MNSKRGLGKGLDSLIVNKNEHYSDTVATINDKVSRETYININLIEPNQSQPRRNFDEDSLHELADSVKLHGVIQPLIVHKNGTQYEIIAGERRWRAARIAGLKEVPVIIKEYSKQQILEIALIENIQREDLNAIEEAQAFEQLVKEFKLKQDEIAERVGKSRVAITNTMRLLQLDKRVQQMIIDQMITGGHARALLGITDSNEQYAAAMKVFDEKLSVRETERLVKKLTKEKSKKEIAAAKEDSFIYNEIEERMKTIFGSKVEIKRVNDNKGKIEIEYYSQEDLERIIELMDSIK